MYKWFRKRSFVTQVIIVVVVLIAAWTVLQIVLGLIRALLPIAILAVLIVGGLRLFEKVKDD